MTDNHLSESQPSLISEILNYRGSLIDIHPIDVNIGNKIFLGYLDIFEKKAYTVSQNYYKKYLKIENKNTENKDEVKKIFLIKQKSNYSFELCKLSFRFRNQETNFYQILSFEPGWKVFGIEEKKFNLTEKINFCSIIFN